MLRFNLFLSTYIPDESPLGFAFQTGVEPLILLVTNKKFPKLPLPSFVGLGSALPEVIKL